MSFIKKNNDEMEIRTQHEKDELKQIPGQQEKEDKQRQE